MTAPTVDLRTPADGAVYTVGQVVNGGYSCSDEDGGSGLASCAGTVDDGSPIATSNIGQFDFTVTASDNAGNITEVTHTYTIQDTAPPPPPPPPPPLYNTLRVKKQLRGDVPDGAAFQIRVRCFGANRTVHERILDFDDNEFIELDIPVDHPRCRVREIVDGGAPVTIYTASSPTAETSTGRRFGRVVFGNVGGERGKVVVSNRWPEACPSPGPRYC